MYSTKEMAKKLGISVQTLRNWDKSKKLKANRTPSGRMFYTHEQYLLSSGNTKYASKNTIDDSTIIITGSGTLATEALWALKDRCKKIIIYSRDEHKHRKLRAIFSKADNIRYIIGDIKDKNKLISAMKNVDICIHTAALKMIETGFYSADEVVRVNTVGTMNVAEAAIDTGVKKSLFISSDKACLDYYSRVVLADGSTKIIGDIVENNEQVDLLTYDEKSKSFCRSKIKNWFKNKRNGRKFFSVSYKNARRFGKYRERTIVTEDHEFLTQDRGWVKAKELGDNDMVMTSDLWPNTEQMSLLGGKLLGDGSINSESEFSRGIMRFGQAEDKREWVSVVHNSLKSVGVNGIKVNKSNRPNRQDFYTFSAKASPCSKFLYDVFYKDGKKIIPRNFIKEYFSPIMMSAWFNDDGCVSDNAIRLATHSFKREDVEWLIEFFRSNGFEARIQVCKYNDTEYYETRFSVDSSKKIFSMIKEYTPECCQYKLPKKYRGFFNYKKWDFNGPEVFYDKPIVKEYKNKWAKYVYCLETETGNFVSSNLVVHNCSPLNGLTYGLSKALAESVWLSYNNHSTRDTILFATRYGNVIDSANSFYDILEEQKKNGVINITDKDMTRFYFTIKEAMNLNIFAIENAIGGEIFIPKLKSAPLMTFIDAFAKDFPVKMIGLRGTEKISEEMISQSEMKYSYSCIDDNGTEYYKIVPPYIREHNMGWDLHRPVEKPIKPFKYTSDSKDVERLSIDDLKRMIKR